ncbi:MAG TPA: PPA1309 family protein [Actinomycetes bacterium]|nr:PPA1309 family protein [Actinomycetes bacterium]
MSAAQTSSPDPLVQVVTDLDRHAAQGSWDSPPRVYALVPTRELLAREPGLAEREDLVTAAATAPDSLAPVEQDDMPAAPTLEESLARIAWPAEVVGAAVVLERIVLPAGLEAAMPADEQEALRWVATHPRREEVRLTVAVLRDGRRASAVRMRRHDEDASVLRGPDLAPALADHLAHTLTD